METLEGSLQGSGLRVAVVAARWNSVFTDRLLEGAVTFLEQCGVTKEDLQIVRVPGSYEIPLACRELARSGKFSALVALGTLIKGETDHYDLIMKEVGAGLTRLQQETGIPVGLGIITVNDQDQALARCGSKHGNKGTEAAMAAVSMANLLRLVR